jgi:hypothetical protein
MVSDEWPGHVYTNTMGLLGRKPAKTGRLKVIQNYSNSTGVLKPAN